MPQTFVFDTQDLAAQIDVLRDHLRHLYSMQGPVPADLAADHDMAWHAKEAERLKKEADDAEAQAAALKSVLEAPPPEPKTPADMLADKAAAARQAFDDHMANSPQSGVAAQEWGEGYGSNRDPNAPRPGNEE